MLSSLSLLITPSPLLTSHHLSSPLITPHLHLSPLITSFTTSFTPLITSPHFLSLLITSHHLSQYIYHLPWSLSFHQQQSTPTLEGEVRAAIKIQARIRGYVGESVVRVHVCIRCPCACMCVCMCVRCPCTCLWVCGCVYVWVSVGECVCVSVCLCARVSMGVRVCVWCACMCERVCGYVFVSDCSHCALNVLTPPHPCPPFTSLTLLSPFCSSSSCSSSSSSSSLSGLKAYRKNRERDSCATQIQRNARRMIAIKRVRVSDSTMKINCFCLTRKLKKINPVFNFYLL